MTDKSRPLPPLKSLTLQDWELLIDDFQHGGASRLHKWTSTYTILPSLLDQALSSLLKRDFSLKLALILFLEEFSETLFEDSQNPDSDSQETTHHPLHRLVEALRVVLQTPVDGVQVTLALKEQMMVSVTSIVISLDTSPGQIQSLVELLLTVINRPNYGSDRQARAVACECLRELEMAYPCLLSDIAGHLWSLCQNERTHASQSYVLLFSSVIHNIVAQKLNVSILNTSVPLIPFSVPQILMDELGFGKEGSAGLNYKELRRAMAFLLEWPQVLTPCAMVEFLSMIIPLATALDLQASMLKVQFFGMIYSYEPMLCHAVLAMYSQFLEAFDGQEGQIARRLMLISRETQHSLVIRLLALHWLLGFCELELKRDAGKMKPIVAELGLNMYPNVFDPLAIKALKLDLLVFCSICRVESGLGGGCDAGNGKEIVKLFKDGIVSVSGFKWLPAGSTETAVAFRTFHKFLIGASCHSDSAPSTTRSIMESNIFRTLQGMLVDVMLEYHRLVPMMVAFADRLLGCQKHCWLGERLLQTFDEHLLLKVKMGYKLVSYFPVFERIAENDTIPPRGLLELLGKFMVFLVEKHGPDTGLKSWSHGSRVLSICRTLLIHHSSSRLFLGLSRLLAYTCLYFPDLEIRDNARIYLRMLICVPGKKLRDMIHFGEQILGISASSHSSSFFNVPSPRAPQNLKKSKNISSYVHLERVIPLLVKQSWSLSLSSFSIGNDQPYDLDGIRDSEPVVEEREADGISNIQTLPEIERIDQPTEPLRVMDSKISEILGILRRHFSCIPDFRHMVGLKVRISCSLRFESEPFNRVWGDGTPMGGLDDIDGLPAIYATVLKFSSSAPYGSIPSYHIPFLLGEPLGNKDIPGQRISLDIVPLENVSEEEKRFRAPVMIELEPQEPSPGMVDVFIETNAEDGQIINGQLRSVTVGIEDMFLRVLVPPDVEEDAIPGYCLDLFSALWEACGTSCNTGRETFPLQGGKGVAAINGTQSVKLLEIPAPSLIRAIEQYLAPFVVSVIGEPLVTLVKGGEVIRDIIWKDVASDSSLEVNSIDNDFDGGPLQLTYMDDLGERDRLANISKRNLGCILVLIFLPPRFHLLFQMEVSDVSTLVRIRTDHWPCLAYIDEYLEALFLT